MKILVLHGPNLNLLGKRDPQKYGTITYDTLNEELQSFADSLNVVIEIFHSNHEGAFIDFLQKDASREADGILINPGALTRYGYSLRQALIDHGKPVCEVHLSDIQKTGIQKSTNVFDDVRVLQICGLKEKSYYEGLKKLVDHIKKS